MWTNRIKILALLLTAAIMPSCTSETPVDPGGEPTGRKEIQFGIASVTKGVAIENSIPTTPGMNEVNVYAFRAPAIGGQPGNSSVSSSLQFGPLTITNNVGGLTYQPQYWPMYQGDKLKFIAYWPRGTSNISNISTSTTSGDPYVSISFTSGDDPAKHVDLVATTTPDLYHEPSVDLVMKHALTRVSFSAHVEVSNSTPANVLITSVKLFGLAKSGILYIRDNFTWDISGSPLTNYEFSIANGCLKNEYVPQKSSDSDEKYQPFFKEEKGDLFFIPQDISEMMLEVTMNIEKVDGTTETETNYFIPPEEFGWAIGRHIHYRVTVARDVINLGAEITRWNNDGNNPVFPID